MHKTIHLLLGVAALVGCGSHSEAPAPRLDESQRVQVGIGEPDDSKRGQMSFRITAIRENQKPSRDAPFHEDGGDWTFFDCQAVADSEVVFTVGVKSKRATGDAPFAFGRATLIVKDKTSGERFLSLFGKFFSGAIPASSNRPYEPPPLEMSAAILGEDLRRHSEGGFSGAGGGWTATKWFPEFDGRYGEVYFNYNVGERTGEFGEKDAEYADDLLAVFAGALRDGPRPERTPHNDPNLTLIGPKIGPPRKIAPKRVYFYLFGPQNNFAVYLDDSTVFAVPLDVPDGTPFEVAHFEYLLSDLRVLNEDLDLLVQEGTPETPGRHSSFDLMRMWLLESKGAKKTLLRGPEKDLRLAEASASPDLRYVAFNQWQGEPGTDERSKVLFILDRTTGTERTFRLKGKGLSLINWKDTSDGLRAFAVTNRWPLDDEQSELYIADPSTGTLEHQTDVDALFELANIWSPDQKRRVRIEGHELVVTEVANGHESRFAFHEDDWPFLIEECVEWASPRHVKFNGRRLALIDVTTLKMCFPKFDHEGNFDTHSFKFSSDLQWVLYQGEGSDGKGLFLAPVEMPNEG